MGVSQVKKKKASGPSPQRYLQWQQECPVCRGNKLWSLGLVGPHRVDLDRVQPPYTCVVSELASLLP